MDKTSTLFSRFLGVLVSNADSALDQVDASPKNRRGRRAGVSLGALLVATIRQKVFKRGGMDEHVEKTAGKRLEASTVSRRLASISGDQLEAVGAALLGPIGDPQSNPGGYHRGHRLVGVDGTRFALANTEAILRKVPKRNARRSREEEAVEVAFPDIWACSLVELGPHNPLAVKVGVAGESEIELGIDLLKHLGADDMLLGDRLYGVGWYLHNLLTKSRCGALLLKVNPSQSSRRIEQLEDGSWIVEVDVRSRRRPADIIATHRVREIAYEIATTRPDGKRETVAYRLWTNLMDCRLDPAKELALLYHRRWEHECYYRELKLELKKHKHLDAQLLETAHIQILSMVWASALIARERQRLTGRKDTDKPSESPRQVRFDVVQENMRVLWALEKQIGSILSEEQFNAIAENLSKEASVYTTPRRRARTCPRKVRQNQKHWPKMRDRTERDPKIKITITR
jgi:hypothetical protein